jgi:hypothetical protein
MIEKPDVDTLLAGPLGQWLGQQAQMREEARRTSNRRYTIGAAIVVPLLAALWLGLDWDFEPKAFISLVAGGIAAGWGYAPLAQAIKAMKRGINRAIAEALGLTYQMEFEPGHGFDLARRYALVPSYDRAKFEDQWSGSLSTRAFTLHEAHLEERRGSGKNRRWVTVFRGAILTIAFDRRFHGTTKVERAGKHRSFFGGARDSIELDGQVLDYVDMVHPEFEDLFSVWSNDQVEARYLVHPAYVERVLAVEQAFHGKDVRTLFHGGELVIVIASDDMFESGTMHASEDRAKIERCVDQFMTLVGLCEALNEPARPSTSSG